MTRKLLPYEYQIIDALGITKEEYLDFVAALPVYEDPKQGTVFDIQNAETVAIVLAVVGILFQAAAIIFAPGAPNVQLAQPNLTAQRTQPDVSTGPGVAQSRDQRYSPRFGFDGAQELSTYGEVLPLIYTNTAHNSQGGVRVSTALLWSAVLSFGGNQFMRLLLSVGAGKIGAIDVYRTAIGQLPLRDYVESNVWAYFNPSGYARYSQLANTTNTFQDPTLRSPAWRATAHVQPYATSTKFGFSQSYAPSTSASCGVTAVVPINVKIELINGAGAPVRQSVFTDLSNTGDYWQADGDRPLVPVGAEFVLTIPTTEPTKVVARIEAAQKARRGEAGALYPGARFKIGSAILRLTKLEGSTPDEGTVKATLVCEKTGKFPSAPKYLEHWFDLSGKARTLENSIFKLENSIETFESEREVLEEAQQAPFEDINAAIRYAKKTGDYTDYPDADKLSVQSLITRYKRFIKSTKTANWATKAIAYIDRRIESETTKLNAELIKYNKLDEPRAQSLYMKCLAHIEEIYYASTTKCSGLDFALRVNAFRRLSGRQEVYGTEQTTRGYRSSENGLQPRTVMFRLYWRFAGTSNYTSIPYVFCVRNSTEQSVFTYFTLEHIQTIAGKTRAGESVYWEVKAEPVVEPVAELSVFKYCYLIPNGAEQVLPAGSSKVRVRFSGSVYDFTEFPPISKTPRRIYETDLYNYDSSSQSSFSFEQGPEINITAVNELRHEPWRDYSSALYNNIATLGLHVFATTTTKSLRNVSTWVTEGKLLRPLQTNLFYTPSRVEALVKSTPSESSSYAPDIFLDTVLDDINGIGKYASIHSVDVQQLNVSKRFCMRNKLFMDGVIASQRSWREFWAQAAASSLLELAKIGGRDALVPAVPYSYVSGRVDPAIPISGLFTAGNILADSYKEEFMDYGSNVQDVVIDVIYRDSETKDVFPRNNSVEVYLKDVDPDSANRQSLDVSQYVTRREQAVLVAKYLCLTKHYVRRAIEFKTFPTDTPVFPGAYVFVEVGMNQWNSIYSGRIEAGGVLNAPLPREVPNGTYTVFVYNAGQSTVSFSDVVVSNGTAPALASYVDSLFVLGTSVKSKRVFRITEVEMDEEGETTIKAVEHPTNDAGESLIAKRLVGSSEFYVDGVLG